MDLKELGAAMSEALALRGMIDSMDEKLMTANAQIDMNRKEISRLAQMEKVTQRMEEDKEALAKERGIKNVELMKRLAKLEEVGVKLPIQEQFGARQVSL